MDGVVLWFTGRPASGKTTIVRKLETILANNHRVEVLDGDELRKWLSPDADFSKEGRERHNTRVIRISEMLSRHGVVVLVSIVSPYQKIRNYAREVIGLRFKEIHVKCSLDTCIKRDPKGHYLMALKGEIKNMTGIQDQYEEPLHPDLVLDTEKNSLEESVQTVINFLKSLQ